MSGRFETDADIIVSEYRKRTNGDLHVDAVQLAMMYGLRVRESEKLNIGEDTRLVVDGSTKVVLVGINVPFPRSRFGVGREVCYYLLNRSTSGEAFVHGGRTRDVDMGRSSSSKLALCVLMPSDTAYRDLLSLEKAGCRGKERLERLSTMYKLPEVCVKRRLKLLF